jgi:Glycosyl transferases group 1
LDGANYQTRREVLGALAKEFRMNEWSWEHTYEELADAYPKTRIVVNVGRDNYPTDVSLRFAEAMAAGALFITQLPSELENLELVEGVHYVGFRDRAEITWLVRPYLSDESSRWRIAQAGREKVLQERTYYCRVEVLLVRLRQAEGKFFAPARQWPESRVRLAYLDYFVAHQLPVCASAELRRSPG